LGVHLRPGTTTKLWCGLSCDPRTGLAISVSLGGVLADVPVPADYEEDGKADIAVYRSGTWFILGSSDVQMTVGWGGAAEDIPLS
jgi:hypothetical protein